MPKDSFRAFVKRYVSLKDEEWSVISSKLEFKEFKKGELLLEEGNVCNHLSFLENGLLRFFIWHDGEKVSKFFTIAPYIFTSQRSFNLRIPAKESVEALEDSFVWQIDYEDNQKLLKMEVWNTFAHKLTQEVQFFTENILENLQNKTAEQRYRELLEENPLFIQRIPLKHLASFLGITQQSLSRIRKNIS